MNNLYCEEEVLRWLKRMRTDSNGRTDLKMREVI